jgi:hypothetical protein
MSLKMTDDGFRHPVVLLIGKSTLHAPDMRQSIAKGKLHREHERLSFVHRPTPPDAGESEN